MFAFFNLGAQELIVLLVLGLLLAAVAAGVVGLVIFLSSKGKDADQ